MDVRLFVFFMMPIVFLAGCTSTPTEPQKPTGEVTKTTSIQETIPQSQVVTLGLLFGASAGNWDADPDVDGLKLTLEPKDKNDKLVQTDGTVDAILRESVYDESYNRVKGNVLATWSDVKLSKDENCDIFGCNVRLEYPSNLKPKSYDMGWLEVTLTTPDGRSFTAKDDSVFLSGF